MRKYENSGGARLRHPEERAEHAEQHPNQDLSQQIQQGPGAHHVRDGNQATPVHDGIGWGRDGQHKGQVGRHAHGPSKTKVPDTFSFSRT